MKLPPARLPGLLVLAGAAAAVQVRRMSAGAFPFLDPQGKRSGDMCGRSSLGVSRDYSEHKLPISQGAGSEQVVLPLAPISRGHPR